MARNLARDWLALATPLFAALGLLVAACGNGEEEAGRSPTAVARTTVASTTAPAPGSTASRLEGSLTVFAASSLTDSFNKIGEAFREANPDVDIEFSFAGSSALATQINEGAPADVFAAADAAQMRVVTDAGNGDGQATIFATNRPVVIVPAGSTAVTTFEDLAEPGIALVLTGPEVPIGRYAREILAKASAVGGIASDFGDRVLANLRSNEANVRAVLAKVELGEADAGVVYATDAAIAGDEVTTIDVPREYNVVAEYPITALKETRNGATAAAFVEFVLSDEGQAILADHGFGPITP